MNGAAELAQAMALRLAQRAREEWESQDQGLIPNPLAPRFGPPQVSVNPLTNVPVLGGLINRTMAGPLHTAGLLGEGAGNVGQAFGGELALAAALAQAQFGDPSHPATQAAQAALAQGPLHPGRAMEALRTGPDPATAWLAGGLELASNPLNYALPAAAAAKAANLPRLAALLKGAGEIGNVPFSLPGMARVAEPAARAAAEAGVTRPLAQTGPSVITGPARDTNLANFMAGAHPALLNADGSPKVFYHGTQAGNFDQFAIPERPGLFGRGVYLTERPEMADYYAGEPGVPEYGADNPRPAGPAGPNVKPVYVNLKNPLIDKGDTALLPREQIRDYALARGHDGIITGTSRPLSQGGGLTIDELIAFDPAAIKSATGNVGTFDPANPSLLHAGLAPAALRAGTGAIGGAGAGAAAFGEGETMKRQNPDGSWVDIYGQPTTPPDVLGAGLKGALIGGAGGAAFGALRRPQAGGDLAAEGDRLAATLGQQADLNLPAPETLGQIAPNLIDYLRGFVKNPATFDPARFRSEALANDAANSLGDFFAQNWPRVQSGKLDRQQLLAALIPTRLSIRRGPVGEGGIAKVAAAYPELEGTLRDAAIQGGPDAGKVRPEDIASYLILHTDEGRALARAIDQGDRGALAAALPRFKQIWPGSLMGHEAATFWDTVQHGKLGQATDLINQAGAAGAEPGTITAMLRQGTSDYDRIKGIATGKVPFLAGQLGIASDLPVFDSKVIATLHEGASPAQYKALLEQLYPWAKDDPFRAHQYFWDSVQRDLSGVGAQTPHPGLMAAQEAARQGDLLGANLSPQQIARNLGPVGAGVVKRAAVGGLAGGTYGAFEGTTQAQPPTTEERVANAFKGAAIGAAGAALGPEAGKALFRAYATHAPGFLDRTIMSPEALALIKRQADQAMATAGTTRGAKLAELPAAADAFWRNQVVNTFRGLGLDAASLYTLVRDYGRDYGVDPGMVRGRLQEMVQHFDAPNPIDRLGSLAPVIKGWGLDKLVDDTTGLKDVVGTGFIQNAAATKGPQLSSPQRILAGAGLSFANLREAVVPVVGPVYGAVRGHYAPWLNAAYGTANGLQHAAVRTTFWQAALERDLPQAAAVFADQLRPTGIDLAPLLKAGTPVDRAGLEGFLAKTYKGLTPDEIKQFGTAYEGELEMTAVTDGDQIARIFGDFREHAGPASAWHAFLSKIFPFSRYATTMLPTYARSVKRHPLIAAGILGGTAASALAVRHNREPLYNAGQVPISTETPVLGGLARARLGGQAGTVRVNPVALLGAPIETGLVTGMPNLPANATGYEKAAALAELFGHQFHPGIQAAAALAGQTGEGPSPLSRTANIEQAAELVPGMPMLPSAQGPFDAARAVLTGHQADDFDAVARRYAELVMDKTHQPLAASSNRDYLQGLGDVHNPLWLQARQEVRVAQLVGGLSSNLTPLSSTATGADAQHIRQVAQQFRVPQGYTGTSMDYALQLLRPIANENPDLAFRLWQQLRQQYPELRAYEDASTEGRAHALTTYHGIPASPLAQPYVKAAMARQAQRQDRPRPAGSVVTGANVPTAAPGSGIRNAIPFLNR